VPVKDQNATETIRWGLRDITVHKQAEETIRRNSMRNAVLSEVSGALAEAILDEKVILDIVVKAMARLVGDGCVIALASPDGQYLDPVAWSHQNPKAAGLMDLLYTASRHKSDDGLSGQVFQTSRSALLQNVAAPQASHAVNPAYHRYSAEVGVSSLLVVPLKLGNRTVGTMGISRDAGGQPYTADDQALLESLAGQTAQSIHNARLYQELQAALQKELEMQDHLVQSEKFAAIGRLLASITHEINNPLQTIKNCLYLSQQDTLAGTPVFEYLNMASAETDRLANLVAQLREVYRPPTSQQVKPVRLPVMLSEVRTLLAGYLLEKHVTWKVNPYDNIFDDLLVEAVPDQVKQVFLNISLNAVDAMEPLGGSLTIQLKMSPDQDFAGVCFQDNGPGISPDVKAHLFEPFNTTKEKGLGLGLTICYDIIQKHNGSFEIASEPGEGAAFTVWLPVRTR
jgi:signal transduction histidine kinase